MDNASFAVVDARLEDYEQAIERVEFLRKITSGVVVFCVLAFLVVGILTLGNAFFGVMSRWPVVAVSAAILGASLGIASLIALMGHAIKLTSVASVVLFPAIFGLAAASYGLWMLWDFMNPDCWSRGMGPIREYRPGDMWCSTTGLGAMELHRWRYAVMLVLLIPASLGVRIVWDAWRFARAPKTVRALAILNQGGVAPALGAHPVCQFLPGAVRPTLSSGLFIVAATALISAIVVLLYAIQRGFTLTVMLANQCYGAHPSSWQSCVSSGMLPWFAEYLTAAVVLGVVVLAARVAARRISRVSLEQLSETDRRPPVLFLRPFLDDQVKLRRPRRPFWHWLITLGEPTPNLDRILLEEATAFGPVVAIGVPGSPPPFGAARTYREGDEWQAEVARLSGKACAIAVVIDDTDGVLWELAHIRQTGHEAKSVFLLPDRLTGPDEAVRVIQRDIAEAGEAVAIATAAAVILRKPGRRCVGWYRDGNRLLLLTTRRASSRSYVCALRLAFARGDAPAAA